MINSRLVLPGPISCPYHVSVLKPIYPTSSHRDVDFGDPRGASVTFG